MFFLWQRAFARNVEFLWDQSRQLPTFKFFTQFNTVYALFYFYILYKSSLVLLQPRNQPYHTVSLNSRSDLFWSWSYGKQWPKHKENNKQMLSSIHHKCTRDPYEHILPSWHDISTGRAAIRKSEEASSDPTQVNSVFRGDFRMERSSLDLHSH